MRLLLLLLFGVLSSLKLVAQPRNVIIITTDGFRWQELYGGMDTALANNKKFNEGDSLFLYKKYWAANPLERRIKLMPFMWQTLVNEGALYGNRSKGNKVDVANPHWFSFPGYSEIFTGIADEKINSNSYPPNPYTNLLEFLNKEPEFKNKVAAFGAWEAFDRILNEERSKFPVTKAYDSLPGKLTADGRLIQKMLQESYKPWHNDECLDVFTHYAAMDYLKNKKPRVLFIGYGETDEWAHAGKYKAYLEAAHQVDSWLKEIWQYLQSDPQYRNNTLVFITTDHGRGDAVKAEWTSHGSKIKGASETWFAILSPNVKSRGEVTEQAQYYAKQFAQTIASLLGKTFTATHPIADKISIK